MVFGLASFGGLQLQLEYCSPGLEVPVPNVSAGINLYWSGSRVRHCLTNCINAEAKNSSSNDTQQKCM